MITELKTKGDSVIIGTDQNFDYLKLNRHRNTEQLFELNMNQKSQQKSSFLATKSYHQCI